MCSRMNRMERIFLLSQYQMKGDPVAATKTKPATKIKPETYPELLEVAEALATPIDFDQLILDGVLRKAGSWYEILDPARLPDSARLKIKGFKSGNRVRFRKPSKRAGKFLDSLAPTGQPA
jgi:hypothetical protein